MTSIQGSVESDVIGEFPYRADHATGSVNLVIPLSIPLQPCPVGFMMYVFDGYALHQACDFLLLSLVLV
ncbi:unnamed protein product [Amaranthus hypochondriacus]